MDFGPPPPPPGDLLGEDDDDEGPPPGDPKPDVLAVLDARFGDVMP
eukprot:CAMPEP_0206628786 /NCGR_PEP_ID=MMETSP0325_2-20121206/66700_1 /ASSEMBLY_ACC=CAM_ASM_000347 /TAXON_ID=2866 /ORGANISM="Crypthecodinium cohnii, Strain Seligo" /LENGTH=45 /DNA_ID= /DNA_START= /DNA_END= /DNA_ORIENTATION=